MNPLTLWLTKGREQNVAALLTYLVANAATAANPARIYVCLSASTPRDAFLEHAQALYNAALAHSSESVLDIVPIQGLSELASATESGALRLTRSWISASPGFQPCYRYVAVGGTFDHLHSGHKLLLSTAILYATEKLRVGVTGDALLLRKKFREQLQPTETRIRLVRAFLEELRSDVELEIDVIEDVSGGTDVIEAVEALVVSPETEASLATINPLREKNGFTPLIPIRIPYVKTSSGTHISSTFLRERLANNTQTPA